MSFLELAGFVASVATAIGVFLAWYQIRSSAQTNRSQFEDQLAREFREILKDLPLSALLGNTLPQHEVSKHLRAFYRYFDLCNEQLFLKRESRISDKTWRNWSDGIKDLMLLPAFNDAWSQICDYPAMQPSNKARRFEELRGFLEEHNLLSRDIAIQKLSPKTKSHTSEG